MEAIAERKKKAEMSKSKIKMAPVNAISLDVIAE